MRSHRSFGRERRKGGAATVGLAKRPKTLVSTRPPVLSAVHDFPTGPVVLIYVAPHKDGLTVLEKDGQGSDGKSFFFQTGDVFARMVRSQSGGSGRRGHHLPAHRSTREEWRQNIESDLLGPRRRAGGWIAGQRSSPHLEKTIPPGRVWSEPGMC